MVVKLPGDVLWAISMRAPFGTCDLEYVTNMQKLASQYQLTADHPMVATPARTLCMTSRATVQDQWRGTRGDRKGEVYARPSPSR